MLLAGLVELDDQLPAFELQGRKEPLVELELDALLLEGALAEF
jgi:hypothetical protein